MKNIKELTEEEILALTDADVELMVKLAKAEAGIKIVNEPKKGDLFKTPKPTNTYYYCSLLGKKLAFANMEELQRVIKVLQTATSVVTIKYDYNVDSSIFYADEKLDTVEYSYSNDNPFSVKSEIVYSNAEFAKIASMLKQNKIIETKYNKELDEYNKSINESKDIESNITDVVYKIREKYAKLNEYCRKYKQDYLPIAEGNSKIALGFITKAYDLTEEEQNYML